MELRHLQSFVYVAENLSFSVAAIRCCVTQSAISQHIKSLEDEMGCKLLIRTSHEITLTEYGEALLPRAKTFSNKLPTARSTYTNSTTA